LGTNSNDYTGFWNSLIYINYDDYKDIKSYNEASQESIELYCNFSNIFKLAKQIKNNEIKNNGEKAKVIENFISLLKELDNSKIRKNPPVVCWILKATFEVLKEHYRNNNNDNNKDVEYVQIFEKYQEYVSLFDEYIKDKQYNDISELTIFPPFQWSFYEIDIENGLENASFKYKELNDKDIEDKLISKKNPYFFFRSYGLEPLNLYSLKQENEEFLSQYYEIQYLKIIYEAQKRMQQQNFQDVQEKIEEREKELDKLRERDRQSNITILGILGSFIAFVSFATGTLKAVDTVAEFVIFAFVFCTAVGVLGWFIRGVKFDKINDFSKMQKGFLWFILVLISAIIITFIVWFCIKDFKDKNIERIIIQKEVQTNTETKIETQSNSNINVNVDSIKIQTNNRKENN